MPPEAAPPPAPTPAVPPPAAAAPPVDPAAPKPVDGAPDVPPGTGEPPKAKDRASLARTAHALREKARAFKEQESAWEKERAELQTKLGAAAELEKQLGVLKSEREAFLKDPIAWAAKNGGPDAEKAIRHFVETSTPEAAIREANERAAAAERAASQAAADLKAFIDGQKQREEKAEQDRIASTREHASESFSRRVQAEQKKYPYLVSMYEPAEIKAKAAQVHDLALKNGESLTFDDVANAFETFAKQAYEKKEQRRQELLTPSTEGEPGSAPGVQAKPVPGNGRREANGPGTSTPPQPKPKPQGTSRILSRKEQREADLAAIRIASEKDKKARAAADSKH